MLKRCALRKFHTIDIVKTRVVKSRVREGPHVRDKIAFPFIFSGSPHEVGYIRAIAAVRRLLLLISANNRRTTLFQFESSKVTAKSKIVCY